MALIINTRKQRYFIQIRDMKKRPIYTTGFTVKTDEPIEQLKDKLIAFCRKEVE